MSLNPYNLTKELRQLVSEGKVIPIFTWNKQSLIHLKTMLDIYEEDLLLTKDKIKQGILGSYISVLKKLIKLKEKVK